MKNLCLFASYFTGNSLPYYITVYLKELKKHFHEVVLLTSQSNLSTSSNEFLKTENIQQLCFDNKGYDFGLWYNAFQKIEVENYDKIALVNDSCILFKPLDDFTAWSRKNTADLQGITFSESVSTHIQSYFLILNRKAIVLTKEYFNEHKVLNDINKVIEVYEIGLSTHLLNKGLKIAAFIDNNGYKGEFSPYYQCVNYHIEQGIPLIKKKIMFSSYRSEELFTLARMNFNIDPDVYIQKIEERNTNLIMDFGRLKADIPSKLSVFSKLKYNFKRISIGIFRPLYKLIKGPIQ